MSEHRQEHLDLCAAWAIGSIDASDRRALEQHLAAGCPECEAAMADFGAATVALAATVPSVAPSAGLRDRVLAAAAASRPAPEVPAARGEIDGRGGLRAAEASRGKIVEIEPRRPWTRWIPMAAAAALTIATGFMTFQSFRLQGELAATRTKLAQLEQQRAEEAKWNAVLHAPEARISVLEPTTAGDPKLRARATYDPASKRAVVVFENLYKPTARDYELWVIKDGVPASLGVVHADDQGHALVQLENVGDSFSLSAFAVSLEPEGGSPNHAAPSGPVVMLGKLGG